MIGFVALPLPLREQLRAEALGAWPRECCGLVEGAIDGSTARVTALHPMPNLALEPDRFEIDPAAHIALLRTLRGSGRDIIGCYHSHPNGKAEPSERDREAAMDTNFLWLICSLETKTQATTIAAFVGAGRSLSPVPITAARETAGACGPT